MATLAYPNGQLNSPDEMYFTWPCCLTEVYTRKDPASVVFEENSVGSWPLAVTQSLKSVGQKPGKDVKSSQEATVSEFRNTHARLGIIRLDYEYPPAPGDIDSPESFGYPVVYRMVPGLSFDMCQAGVMPPDVVSSY